MKLDYDVTRVPTHWQRGKGKWIVILSQFVSSGKNAAKVILDAGVIVHHARSAAAYAAKQNEFPVIVMERKGELYFIRKEAPDAIRT